MNHRQENHRRRWLTRAVKIMVLIALVVAMIPFCSGLAPRGKPSHFAPAQPGVVPA